MSVELDSVEAPRAAGPHDIGGDGNVEPIDRSDPPIEDWEILADAIHQVLVAKGARRHDQLRRVIESLDKPTYDRLSYFARRVWASEVLLVQSGVLTEDEIDQRTMQVAEEWGT